MLSRESSFLFNNLILLVACVAVSAGTLFPVLSEAVRGSKISVGPPFFNRVNIPIAMFLLFLTGVGPLLAWRKTSVESLRENFGMPADRRCIAAAVAVALGIARISTLALCLLLSRVRHAHDSGRVLSRRPRDLRAHRLQSAFVRVAAHHAQHAPLWRLRRPLRHGPGLHRHLRHRVQSGQADGHDGRIGNDHRPLPPAPAEFRFRRSSPTTPPRRATIDVDRDGRWS